MDVFDLPVYALHWSCYCEFSCMNPMPFMFIHVDSVWCLLFIGKRIGIDKGNTIMFKGLIQLYLFCQLANISILCIYCIFISQFQFILLYEFEHFVYILKGIQVDFV